MTLKKDTFFKRMGKRFSDDPFKAFKFYFNLQRIGWFVNKKQGKSPTLPPVEEFRFIKDSSLNKKRLTLRGLTKNCLIAKYNSSFDTIDFEVKDKTLLNFSLRLDEDIKKDVLFKANIDKDVIFSLNVTPEMFRYKDWIDVNVELDKYKGKKIKISFSNELKGQESGGLICSEPILINQRDKPNIVLISIDACRKDHLGCYGYSRNTTPNLDNIKSLNFNNIFTQTLWTDESHAALHNGIYPSSYKLINSKKIVSLAETLRDNGYINYAFTSHWRLGPVYMGKGFDYFNFKQLNQETNEGSTEEIVQNSISFLRNFGKASFFMFLHLFDVHEPYLPPYDYSTLYNKHYEGKVSSYDYKKFRKKYGRTPEKLTNEDLRYLIGLYDGCINYVDEELGKLFSFMKIQGIYDDSLIIVMSDHGDEFMDHGSLSHVHFYDEVSNVPLLVKLPKAKKIKYVDLDTVGQIIDIYPTILDVIGVNSSSFMEGKSLFDKNRRNISISEHVFTSQNKNHYLSFRTKDYKYIYRRDKRGLEEELYNLVKDPKEKINICEKEKAKLTEMRDLKKEFTKRNLTS